ncbi:MAG: GNAT family N-acetyltransferase [Candidatus Dormibacteria bacterium]
MIRVEPLTAKRWDDFAALCRSMGPNRSCWCMWWRHDRGERRGSAKERARALVAATARPIGLLAYLEDEPVGWAAVAPREEYPRLNRNRDTAPVDGRPGVWVVPCFFVVEEHRSRGVTRALLDAAVDLATAASATAIEGVPRGPATRQRTPAASYTGGTSLFAAAGFLEVARRSPKGRVVMRREL